MISMTPYSAFMLGAATNTYGTNLANFWVYNPENYKFEDIKRLEYHKDESAFLMTITSRFVPAEHVWGYWTTVKRKDNFRALTNCVAERTYVAVGWGGTDWVIFRHLSWR